ncbi:hypothetical protein Hanom_Chr03g00236681 [Helianthus anomalus]
MGDKVLPIIPLSCLQAGVMVVGTSFLVVQKKKKQIEDYENDIFVSFVLCLYDKDFNYRMTNISVFYVDYHVVFYIYSSTMTCLKFLLSVRVWILRFSDLHFVICGF